MDNIRAGLQVNVLGHRAVGVDDRDMVVHALQGRIEPSERVPRNHLDDYTVAGSDHGCTFGQIEIDSVCASPIRVGCDRTARGLKDAVSVPVGVREAIGRLGADARMNLPDLDEVAEFESVPC